MPTNTISILVAEPLSDEGLSLLKSRPDFNIDAQFNLDKNTLCDKISAYDALLVRSQTKVDRDVISSGKNLKLIGRAGVGLDNIDVKYAKERDITVFNTPLGNSISTAEFSFALMISLARKIPFAQNHLKQGLWQRSQWSGFELHKKVLGIFGFGNVGRELAKRAKAFGMRVLTHDPLVDASVCAEYGAEKMSMDDMLKEAHFISLNCVLNDSTKHMISAPAIQKMRPGVAIINTARGELIDSPALIDALNNNHVSYAAIDVFSKEPPHKDDPLLTHDKILVTPHLGASTTEAQNRVGTELAEKTIAFFNGRV